VIDPVICGTSGVLATVVLDYDPAVLGEIAGMFLQLGYPTFLSIPGSLNAGSVTARVSDLTGAGAFFFPVDRDTNSDGTDDQLRTNYLIDPGTVPPGDFERVLFDCVPGTGVRPADFACSLADVVDPFTNLYPQATIDQLTSCFVSILEAPGGGGTTTTTAPPTSSTVATTSTTSSTTTTISITCGNGTPEGAEQCDDGNENPSDGCTNACTACGNSTTTAPETCDDGDLDDGDGCDSNCTVTACGNGLVVGSETCDDGNTSNNDSCPADCIVDNCTPLGGTDRQVSLTFSGSNVAWLTVLLDYPEGKVSIPGSGSGVPAGIITDNPGGSFANANDLDHALRELVAAGGAITPGLLFRVHFEDCQGASAPSAGEFTCTVVSASDPDSQPVGGVTCAVTIP
jgi:cysteine-rich repeat protein